MKIYNTMARMKEELVPLTAGEIKMYSCGVTVYDLSHVGHARMLMVFDVIARYLRFAGYRVTFVRLDANRRPVSYEPFAEGWLEGERAFGRPADVEVAPDGSLLIADDTAGAVYRAPYVPHRFYGRPVYGRPVYDRY